MVEQIAHTADCGCAEEPDALGRAQREIRVAIALVACGMARTVHLANLPAVEHAAAEGVARAQTLCVALRLVRDGRTPSVVVIGPRIDA